MDWSKLNPFNYSLAQLQSTLIALAIAVISIVGFFIALKPGFEQAFVVVISEVFAVVGVFLAKEHTYDDLSKAITNLAGGVVTLVGFFATLNPDTAETVLAIVSQVLMFGAVLFKSAKSTPSDYGATA